MRAHPLLLAPAFLFLLACSTTPHISPHYSSPSVAPVRQRIANAQTHVAAAVGIAKQARGAATLELKDQFIDQLTLELVSTQTALKESDAKASDLQGQVESITDTANREASEKNAAITQKSKAEAHDAATSRRYHTVKFYLCTAAAAVALLLAFQFRWVLALLGPWGVLAGLAGLPALVFGALWMWL